MTDETAALSRRALLRSAAGGTAAMAAGTAAAQEEDGGGGGGPPDFGGFLSGVGNYDGSTVDATGKSEVTVKVGASGNGGNFAFDPPAVHVDNGATVIWEWTGEGGGHNVVAQDGTFDSGSGTSEAGFTFEHTFESDGIYNYVCEPHESLNMKGSVVVGTDYPTKDTGGGGGGPALPDTAKSLGVASAFVMVATLGLAYVFMKYGGSGPREG